MWVRRVWRRLPSFHPPRRRPPFFRSNLPPHGTQTPTPNRRVWPIYLLVYRCIGIGEGEEVKYGCGDGKHEAGAHFYYPPFPRGGEKNAQKE